MSTPPRPAGPRVLICPDSFKGSLTAPEACAAIARGVARAWPAARIESVPLADGGEGTARVLGAAFGGSSRRVPVSGPLGDPVDAEIVSYRAPRGRRVVALDFASAAGLTLLPRASRDPLRASSAGVGELIRAALAETPDQVILGLGGSATVDGGVGMARALGVRFPPETPSPDLSLRDPRLANVELVALHDVTNPLLGPHGAAAVFGPQKGASPADVAVLEARLAALAAATAGAPHVDPETPGFGAAGGAGFGVVAYLGARLLPGLSYVAEAVGLDERLARADLVITGEGRFDAQSLLGKVVGGVLERAAAAGVPCVVVSGAGPGAPLPARPTELTAPAWLFSLADAAGSEASALAAPRQWTATCVERALRALRLVP